MNRLAWIGIIVWGLIVTAFGLISAGPPLPEGHQVAAHDVTLLVAGGLLTCLIGIVGLLGFMGWMPGLDGPALQGAGRESGGMPGTGMQNKQSFRA